MKTLTETYNELFEKYGEFEPNGESWLSYSDKGTNHSYIGFYEKYFEKKQKNASLLEIGVMTGGSMHVWQNYFKDYTLVGVDINTDWHGKKAYTAELDADENLKMHWNVNSRAPFANFCLGHDKFDFVIDDGDHSVLAQQETFVNFWPVVAQGGTYFIEDVIGETQMQILTKWLQKILALQEVKIELYAGLKNNRQDDRIIAVTKQ
jgi:hypothetical protein